MKRTKNKRNSVKHTKNKTWTIIIAATLLVALIILFYALYQSGSVMIESNTNTTLGSTAEPPVYQYDLTPLHTYFVNITIPQINISVGQAIYATPTIYKLSLIHI